MHLTDPQLTLCIRHRLIVGEVLGYSPGVLLVSADTMRQKFGATAEHRSWDGDGIKLVKVIEGVVVMSVDGVREHQFSRDGGN